VCHLREFGICDFEVVDDFPAELLVAATRDARGNPIARFGGNFGAKGSRRQFLGGPALPPRAIDKTFRTL
jgi:hypothetical protein